MQLLFLLLLSLFSVAAMAEKTEKIIPQSAAQMQLSFAPLVKTTAPAVVNIYAKKRVKVVNPLFSDPIFQHFFGGRIAGAVRERIESSLGSGVIVGADGLIVTNHHVVQGGEDIRVVLHDRREFEAQIVLSDEKTDLALLRLKSPPKGISVVELSDSETVEVGDVVLAIGNPFGVGQTVTSGIVSAVARTSVSASDYQFFIQTDAAINPGNSGGALINMRGELVGINTAILSKTQGSIGIGFAVPSNMVATVLRGLEKGGAIERPWLGVTTQPITQELADNLKLATPEGALITQIYAKGPGALAGLREGDVVTQIDGHLVQDEQGLRFRVATYPLDAEILLKFIRAGEEKTTKVRLLSPPEEPRRDMRVLSGNQPFAGAKIANLSPKLATEIGLPVLEKGVVILDVGQGFAARLGVERGDIIVSINDVEITSSKNLEKYMTIDQKSWKIVIKRGGETLRVRVGG
jgi:serine protease Do